MTNKYDLSVTFNRNLKRFLEFARINHVDFPKYGFVGLIFFLLGLLIVLLFYPPLLVDAFRIRFGHGIAGKSVGAVNSMIPSPDLWVEVWSGGKVLRAPIKDNVVIGNGVTFYLPGSVPLAKIDCVKFWRKYGVWGGGMALQ